MDRSSLLHGPVEVFSTLLLLHVLFNKLAHRTLGHPPGFTSGAQVEMRDIAQSTLVKTLLKAFPCEPLYGCHGWCVATCRAGVSYESIMVRYEQLLPRSLAQHIREKESNDNAN
jgi:hypothetical protein